MKPSAFGFDGIAVVKSNWRIWPAPGVFITTVTGLKFIAKRSSRTTVNGWFNYSNNLLLLVDDRRGIGMINAVIWFQFTILFRVRPQRFSATATSRFPVQSPFTPTLGWCQARKEEEHQCQWLLLGKQWWRGITIRRHEQEVKDGYGESVFLHVVLCAKLTMGSVRRSERIPILAWCK